MRAQIKNAAIDFMNLAFCGIILAAVAATYMSSALNAKAYEDDTD